MKKSIALLFLMISYATHAQTRLTGLGVLKYKIDSIVNSEINAFKIPGAVVQISSQRRIIFKKAYGYANRFDKNGKILKTPELMTTEHLFDIASLTKVIGTTTAIMKLASAKKFSVDDPIGKYLSAYNIGDKSMITIRHLLTHSAGFYEWYPLYYFSKGNKIKTYQLIASLPLKYPVGKQRKYSDLGFTVLGELIETITQLPLERYLEDSIFHPMGMTNTFYLPVKRGYNGSIAPTSFGNPYEYRMTHDSSMGFLVKGIDPGSWNGWRDYQLRGEVNDGNAWYANGGVSGAAGLFSTAADLQKMIDLLLNKGKIGITVFISETVIKQFLTKDSLENGLGWMMDTTALFMKNAPRGSFGHTGFTGTSIVVFPEKKVSLIILINRQQPGLLSSGEYYNVSPLRNNILQALISQLK